MITKPSNHNLNTYPQHETNQIIHGLYVASRTSSVGIRITDCVLGCRNESGYQALVLSLFKGPLSHRDLLLRTSLGQVICMFILTLPPCMMYWCDSSLPCFQCRSFMVLYIPLPKTKKDFPLHTKCNHACASLSLTHQRMGYLQSFGAIPNTVQKQQTLSWILTLRVRFECQTL